MKKNLFLRLCLILVVALTISSCRTDHLTENEIYNNSSKFQLTSKRISLNESKHKSILLLELEKAEATFKNSKNNVNGRVIDYGNGVSIDTDDVIYIENGPNYHTYTFHVNRDNAPADAPLENLLLVPLPGGKYNEFLITYNLTLAEKERLKAGLPIDTNGKSQVTKLTDGTFNFSGQLAKLSCTEVSETIWQDCGEHVHNKTNVEDWINCKAAVKPRVYTLVTMNCINENDDIITPIDPGGSSGGGPGGIYTPPPSNGNTPPCTGTVVPTNPQPGFTDQNGCPIGAPSLPNYPNPKVKPCDKILQNNIKAKEFLLKSKASGRLAEVKIGIATNANEKSFSLGVDDNGTEQVTIIKVGYSGYSVEVFASVQEFSIKAGVHTHSPGGAAPPSATDMYTFMTANKTNNEFILYYTISYDGNEYVYSIVDPYKFKNFATTYPENEYTDSEYGIWKYGNDISKDFNKVYDEFKKKQGKSKNESFELATAYILKKHNSGVALSKKDINGDFKPIFVEEQQDPNNPKKITYIKTDNCNL